MANTINTSLQQNRQEPQAPDLKARYRKWMYKVVAAATGLWLFDFLLFYFQYTNQSLESSLIRSFGNAGLTLLSAALIASAVFKWWPRTAQYWRVRRYLGVSGFYFALLHGFFVLAFNLKWDFSILFFSFNPYENAMMFGLVALVILLVMACTSFDKIMQGYPKNWKRIHRFVYLAFLAAILHSLIMNPVGYKTVPGAIRFIFSILAITGMIFWFFKTAFRAHFRSAGTVVGIVLIILAIAAFWYAYEKGLILGN